VANPITLSWTGPTQYVDGRPYGQADHGGYELEVNGLPAVAIPTAWAADNHYTFPIASLPNLTQGSNALRMRTVASNGQVSDWTGTVTFLYASVPQAPTAVAVR